MTTKQLEDKERYNKFMKILKKQRDALIAIKMKYPEGAPETTTSIYEKEIRITEHLVSSLRDVGVKDGWIKD